MHPFRSASVVTSLISMHKVAGPETLLCWKEQNPHIRNIRDGTMIKMDVNDGVGVSTMDMRICFDQTGSRVTLSVRKVCSPMV